MGDFAGPSFSLGLDLDLDLDESPPPNNNQGSKETTTGLIDDVVISSIEDEDEDGDEDFELETLVLNPQPQPPILKRLKRGPPPPPPPPTQSSIRSVDVVDDDEIEDISSPEEEDNPNHRSDEHSASQNHSACISSNSSLHGFSHLSTQLRSKSKAKQSTQGSYASALTGRINTAFPKPTISPLRKLQLLDSDSDDPSSSEGLSEDAKKVDVPASKRQCCTNQKLAANQQKRVTIKGSKLQSQDLWKDFGPQRSVNIPTPALDEFCEEYFKSVKDKNINQIKDKDRYIIHHKGYDQEKSISGNSEIKLMHNPLPPAYKYYYHDDPRIQELVCQRLPNFSPHGVNKTETPPYQAADIDYMRQFTERELTSRKRSLEGSCRMGGMNLEQSNCEDLSEISGSWVNPKGRSSMLKNAGKSQGRVGACSSVGPKNAGKRRVRADSRSSGSWYTGEDGRKVYVTKNGRELMGRIAYRHYRKESGTGFKKSRKRVASRKSKR